MILEDIEQKTLQYLKQVSNPLVRIDVLLTHLREEEDFSGLTKEDLVDFLQSHELFKVVAPTGLPDSAEIREAQVDFGLKLDPCVILETRVPSPANMAAMMNDQIEVLMKALATALTESEQQGDVGKMAEVQRVVKHAGEIRKNLKNLMTGDPG